MKGFTKNGKFRPTGNKSKSPLKKSDIRKKDTFDFAVVDRNIGAGVSAGVDRNEEAWLDGKITDKEFDENHAFFKKLGYRTSTRKELLQNG